MIWPLACAVAEGVLSRVGGAERDAIPTTQRTHTSGTAPGSGVGSTRTGSSRPTSTAQPGTTTRPGRVTRCHVCDERCVREVEPAFGSLPAEVEDDVHWVALRNGIYFPACFRHWFMWPDDHKMELDRRRSMRWPTGSTRSRSRRAPKARSPWMNRLRAAGDAMRDEDISFGEPMPRLRTRGVRWDRVRPTRWLWKRRVPMGLPSLIIGEEGRG